MCQVRTSQNNGIGIGIGLNNDSGRYEVTLNEVDFYKFKVPSLRNLKYTAPHIHDGRYYTLDAVLDRYGQAKAHVQDIDPIFDKDDGTNGINLSGEKSTQLQSVFKHIE